MPESQPSSLSTFLQQEPLQQENLPELTANRIRDMILSGKLSSGDRLPNELELSEAMGVSRGTLRSALSILQQKGLVWRRQGVGSFVSERPILENRLDINAGVTDLIESMGLKPGSILLDINLINADEKLSQQLCVSLGSSLVSVRRVRTANDKPVVASIDIFPFKVLNEGPHPLNLEGLKKSLEKWHSIYRVFEHELNITVEYGIAQLKPIKIDAHTMKQIGLDLPVGSVMLYLEQLDFDHDRQPQIISYEYHVADFCTFSVYRRR